MSDSGGTAPHAGAGPNTSGQGRVAELPAEIGRLNWGAFFLNWIWGLGNSTYIALLTLIPPLFLIMPFVLLFKGNQWAWQNETWRSVEEFRRTQRNWAIASAAIYIGIPVIIIGLVTLVLMFFKGLEPVELAEHEAMTNPQIIQYVGSPVELGWLPTVSANYENANGNAEITLAVSGPDASGSLYVEMVKKAGTWSFRKISFTPQGSTKSIAVTPTVR